MKPRYRISEVRLKNVKSHAESVIRFSSGLNLIEGDVGSGKSTILESIEAALLGFRVKGLLRVGEQSGMIRLIMDPESVVQLDISKQGNKGGMFSKDGKAIPCTASQLRENSIKEFRLGESPLTTSEPKVFRTAVYVKQEDLKSILENQDEIEELVRKATGLDRYAVARENAKMVAAQITSVTRLLDERILRLSQSVELDKNIETRLREKESALEQRLARKSSLQAELKHLQEKLDVVQEAFNNLVSEHSAIKSSIKSLEDRRNELTDQAENLAKKILDLETKQLELGEIPKVEYDEFSLEQQMNETSRILGNLERAKQEYANTSSRVVSIEKELERLTREYSDAPDFDHIEVLLTQTSSQLNEYRGVRKEKASALAEYRKLFSLGICPTCRRPVSKEDASKHIQLYEEEIESLDRKIASQQEEVERLALDEQRARKAKEARIKAESLEAELNRLRGSCTPVDDARISQLKNEFERIRLQLNYARKSKEAKSLESQLTEAKSEYERCCVRMSEISEQLNSKNNDLKMVASEREKLDSEMSHLKRLKQDTEEQYSKATEDCANLDGEIGELRKRLDDYRTLVKELELTKERRRLVSLVQEFFSDKLYQSLKQIEDLKLRAIHRDVRTKTKEYFAVLMQDEQRGVELEGLVPYMVRRIGGKWEKISSPSGGERSALALAFRLALSHVSRTYQGIGVDFIILDEPTDGFSSEQLQKFRSVLERLDVGQILLVTHHEVLESIGGNVFKVRYSPDGSIVEQVS
ncbi:MAG: hypothetical protein QW767_00190 [Thermoprotei archaeon]